MAKIDTTYLRRFVDPVNEAGAACRKAIKGLDGLIELSPKARDKAQREYTRADAAYKDAVGEMIGGLNKLIEDAEAEEGAQV